MNWTAAVIFALIAAGLAAWQFPAANPRQARWLCPGGRAGRPGVPRLAACSRTGALALVARHYGLTMNGITLWLFGGVSGLGEAPSPAAEARIAGRWRGVRVGQIMTSRPSHHAGVDYVTGFLADYFCRTRHQGFPVMRDGQGAVIGLVTLDRIKQVPSCERDHTRLADIACPLAEVARAAPGDSVAGILPRLTEGAGRRALVFSNGHLAGIPTASDVSRMVNRHSASPPTGPGSGHWGCLSLTI